jgi:hypothetical protein
MNRTHIISLAVASVMLIAVAWAAAAPSGRWSDAEIQELGTLWIGAL